MIFFKKIRWRNFLSTGNKFTEIEITKAPTNLIIGQNGAGKSTILDALCFVLYNKPFRKINKPQLVNGVNEKDCVVEIEFSINNKEYKIIRGIKPNIFEIWIDGQMQNQDSASLDQQKYLENNILRLNYKSFTQTVILGSATFVPFMQLSASHRREVVEDLLDIRIFSDMNSILKEKLRGSSEIVREYSIKKDLVEDKITMQKDFIADLDKRGKERIETKKKKIKDLDASIEVLSDMNNGFSFMLNQKQEKLEELCKSSKTLDKLKNIKSKLNHKIQNLSQDHEFFHNNTVCPTCTQDIENEFRLNKIGEIENKTDELNKAYNELQSAIAEEQKKDNEFVEISKDVNKINNDISTNNTKISEYQRQSRDIESEIQEIAEQIANRNSERDALKKLEEELDEIVTQKSNTIENISYLEFAHSLMRDGGVKSKIIKRYLPIMNQQINKYLQKMEFYINFTLDEEFKENIKSPIHEDFSYESFSEGEKMRIDLALLFTWRDIAKMRNSSSTNLLILDEIFDSSLDGSGTDFFTVIIRYMLQDTNVFVISHKTEELGDKFDNLLTFEKVNGFSKLSGTL